MLFLFSTDSVFASHVPDVSAIPLCEKKKKKMKKKRWKGIGRKKKKSSDKLSLIFSIRFYDTF